MQVHESFFYPQGKDEVIVAVVNLVPSLKAAASRITIDLVESGLPAAPLGTTRGREIGYYFEESGRWRKFFGGDAKRGILEDMKSLDRWGQWNRYFGANLMFPTVNVYQANHYPSRILDGYFSRPLNEVRLAALIGEKYQQKLVPEMHLTGQDWFDREIMGVWEEKGLLGPVVKFASPEAESTIIRDRDGNTKHAYEPFMYNALNPRVQDRYIAIIGELADSLGDCESFAGISSRMMFTWQWQGWNALPNMSWGYDDWTMALFEKETGIKVPGEPCSPNRFRDRYNFLIGPEKKRWVEWRCAKIFAYHQKLLARIRQARPDAKLVFNWFPLDERHALSSDMLEQMQEVGMDWHQYAKEKDIIVVPPGGTYGRRYSTPAADASKVDGVYDQAIQTVGRFDGRAYGFYSDYYEVNKNMNWADLGGKPFPAFDAGLPSALHERGMYAQAIADCDSGFIANGGSGWIFGTPGILQSFMREYRSLPNVPFEPWDKARDPVAIWSHRDQDGTFWFYAVNRLPVPVPVSIVLNAGDIFPAPGGEKVLRQSDGRLLVSLEPYMLKAFRADKSVGLEDVHFDVPKDFPAGLTEIMAFIRKMRGDLAERRIVPELTTVQTAEALACFDGALAAFDRGEYFAARGLLERLAAVQVYYLSGEFPPGLWQRSQNHGAPSSDQPRQVAYELSAGAPESVADLSFDARGNLWMNAGDTLIALDPMGNVVRKLSLFEPYDLADGDLRKATLVPPRSFLANSVSIAPDGAFLVQASGGMPLRFDGATGRLIDLPNKIFLAPGQPLTVLAITSGNETLVSSVAAGRKGVYLYKADGTLVRKLSDLETAAGAFDTFGRIYLARPEGVEIVTAEGSQKIPTKGFTALEVSRDGGVLFGLEAKTNTLFSYHRGADGKWTQAWSQVMAGPVSAMALAPDGKLAVGFKSPDNGATVRLYSVGTVGLKPIRDLVKSDAAAGAFGGDSRLKTFEGNLYFAENGKIMRLIPGAPDKGEVAFDPGFKTDKSAFESFAFAPNGDLYLSSNWNGKSRGVNVFVCRRQTGGWGQPEPLNNGVPLWEGGNMVARDLAVDSQGRLILRLKNDSAKNGQNISIYRWSQDGGKELLLDLGDAVPDGDYGITRDTNGDILLAGGTARKVARIAADGKALWLTERLKSSPPGYTDLRYPVGIAGDRKGRVWVADPARNQVLEFGPQGKLKGAVGTFGNDEDPQHLSLNRPSGLAVVKGPDGKEWLYVADSGNRRIVKWPLN